MMVRSVLGTSEIDIESVSLSLISILSCWGTDCVLAPGKPQKYASRVALLNVVFSFLFPVLACAAWHHEKRDS